MESRSRISFLDEIAQRFGDCDFKEFQILYSQDAVFQLVYHAMTRYANYHHKFMMEKDSGEVVELKKQSLETQMFTLSCELGESGFSDEAEKMQEILNGMMIALSKPPVIDCGNCKHHEVSKHVPPCYGCRDEDGYIRHEKC